MKLPNGKHAIVDISKLSNYSLSLDHVDGKHKARVFRSALELKASDAEWLREKLLEQAATGDVIPKVPTIFGDLCVGF